MNELNTWPKAKKAGLKYIKNKNGDCCVILEHYHDAMKIKQAKRSPIIGGDYFTGSRNHSVKWYAKKAVKACIPYGFLRLYQLKRYPNGV